MADRDEDGIVALTEFRRGIMLEYEQQQGRKMTQEEFHDILMSDDPLSFINRMPDNLDIE